MSPIKRELGQRLAIEGGSQVVHKNWIRGLAEAREFGVQGSGFRAQPIDG